MAVVVLILYALLATALPARLPFCLTPIPRTKPCEHKRNRHICLIYQKKLA